MMRSHRAGDLRAGDIGESVAICGWVASRRDHGGKVFLDVRDVAGILQVVVDPQQAGLEVAHRLRGEWVVRVVGRRCGPTRREPSTTSCRRARSRSIAGEIEVLNESEPSPFPLDDRVDVDEVLRLRHRYLDLRRAPMQRNLRAAGRGQPRHARGDGRRRTSSRSRRRCSSRRRPEGARDFVVPSRLAAGRVLRAAAEPAAVQAAVDGRRLRPLLPDRALPARRRPPCRPAVRVHAARHRDDVRRPGRRARRGVGRGARGGRGRAAG